MGCSGTESNQKESTLKDQKAPSSILNSENPFCSFIPLFENIRLYSLLNDFLINNNGLRAPVVTLFPLLTKKHAVSHLVQFAAASFVLGHYVKNFRDVLKIGWLPINERRDLNLLQSCFKALHNADTWPDYLKIIKQECPEELRSSNSIRLVVLTENGTLKDKCVETI